MILQVDPGQLRSAATPLREAVEVARDVQAVCRDVTDHLGHSGSAPVQQAGMEFLDAWADALVSLAGRGESLVRLLDVVADSYRDADERAGAGLRAAGAALPAATLAGSLVDGGGLVAGGGSFRGGGSLPGGGSFTGGVS